ncbi:MAG: hypothetical protein E7373_00230 [Clostridiales bacterium]|jgi:hypothetical protein|nr:hypothetical protein [Clostridiales bacterium]
MTSIIVTENKQNEDGLLYVQTSGSELFSHAGCSSRIKTIDDRIVLTVNCPEEYKDIIRTEIADKVAEIITIKYKYDYFKKSLLVGGLSKLEKEILLTSLIAADLEDDKRYAYDRIKVYSEIAIDGIFNFRLKPLKKKWEDVVGCIPDCFLTSQLKEFITYLLENKKKRVYVDDGRVYDSHYRRLKRCSLLGGEGANITREVLLSNCGEVELSGEIPKEDEYYLKEYYNDKIIFSSGYLN